MGRFEGTLLFKVLLVLMSCSFVVLANNDVNADFQAFYIIQQWLVSYCNQQGTPCCYPPTGKPAADFTVYGLWPYFSDNSFPTDCPGSSFDVGPLKPLESGLQQAWPSFTCPQIGRKFWLHEWNKHGPCSKSILDEIPYLQAAIDLKNKINLLQVLTNAGITPNNQSYPLNSIKQAITSAFGFEPWVQCNHNAQGASQIWQISLCVDNTGNNLIKCPSIPGGPSGCDDNVLFPSY